MKKPNPTNLTLEHINRAQIIQLAHGSRCDESYVRKVLSGERNANSALAKAIINKAKLLNSKIEKAYNAVNNKFTVEVD